MKTNLNIIKYFRRQTWDDKAYQLGQFFYALLIAAGIEIVRRVFKELEVDNTEIVIYREPPQRDSININYQLAAQ